VGNNESSTSQGFKFGCGLGLGLIAAVIIVVIGLPIVGLSMCGMCANVTDKLLITKEQAEIEVTESSIQAIATNLEQYSWDNGQFPTTEQGVDALIRKPTLPPEPKKWTEPYLDPNTFENLGKFTEVWGNAYVYRSPSKREGYNYDLYSRGPDGLEGTGDDITNWDE